MKKIQRADVFRDRLRQAIQVQGVTQTALAEKIGIDRSTLSSLLTSDSPRMPNAHWVAEAAEVLQVTCDWLLGLEQSAQPASMILGESLQVRTAGREPYHPQLQEWRREAQGKKIRYVPQNLPDFLKTQELIAFEYAAMPVDAAQHQAASDANLDYLMSSDSDMEICIGWQQLEDFWHCRGVWSGLEPWVRDLQWQAMRDVYDQLYPRVRIQLYNARHFFSAPVTVYGAQRAVVFLGETYFSFSTREHIQAISSQVDRLVRNSEIHSHQFIDWLDQMPSR